MFGLRRSYHDISVPPIASAAQSTFQRCATLSTPRQFRFVSSAFNQLKKAPQGCSSHLDHQKKVWRITSTSCTNSSTSTIRRYPPPSTLPFILTSSGNPYNWVYTGFHGSTYFPRNNKRSDQVQKQHQASSRASSGDSILNLPYTP